MKTIFFISLLSFVIVFTTSCSRSADSIPSNAAQTASQVVTSGTWKVILYSEGGVNETSDFSGFTFAFTPGVISATKSSVTTNGTWSVNTGSNKFNIDLGPKGNTNKPLGELTDDWMIISATDVQIQLKDDNKQEFLTFSKN